MRKKLNINESFICRLWEGGSRYLIDLQTMDGDSVVIYDFGKHNHDSGPDYKSAKIAIGAKTYKGDVEIHRDFNSWFEHSHDKDSAYNSVILHVVLWKDGAENLPKLRKKRDLPTVILSDFLNSSIHEIWQEIIANPSEKFRLQCFGKNAPIAANELDNFVSDLAMERLRIKSQRIRDRLAELSRFTGASGLEDPAGWQQVLYEFLFEALGYSKNKDQMLKLAGIVKLEIIRKKAVNLDIMDIQSLLFGVSGLLFDIRLKDDYITEIKEGWSLLKEDINIPLMQKSEWLFFRMRPQNFPTIRIACGAQFAEKILNQKLLKNIILSFKTKQFDARKCYERISLLLTPEPDKYWSHHYNFGKLSSSPNTLLGQERLADIIVNVIIPLVFLYSNEFDDETIKNNVLKLYHSLKLQTKNSVIKMMISQLPAVKVKSTTASAQQALLQLYNFYCVRERCGECEIGKSLSKVKAFNYRIIFY